MLRTKTPVRCALFKTSGCVIKYVDELFMLNINKFNCNVEVEYVYNIFFTCTNLYRSYLAPHAHEPRGRVLVWGSELTS